MTRFDRAGPSQARTRSNIYYVMQEEREQFSVVARLVNGLSSAWLAEPPPTFPFLESQCQRAVSEHELSFCQRRNTARKVGPNERRGAVYRGVSWECQTYFGLIFSFFLRAQSGPVDGRI